MFRLIDGKPKILKMQYPIITTYSTETNMLAVFSDSKPAMAWFFENYFQLFTNGRFEYSSYIDFWAPLPWVDCPFFETNSCDFITKADNMETLIRALDDNFYVFLPLNRKYLFNSDINNQKDFVHEAFIYGYCFQDKLFYLADFFRGKYDFIKVSFENVTNAYVYANNQPIRNDAFNSTLFLRFTNVNDYIFSLQNYKRNVESYFCSKPIVDSKKTYRQYYYEHKEQHIFGLDVYDFLVILINKVASNNIQSIDMRGFHMLYEHKNITLQVLNYLTECEIFGKEHIIFDLCNDLINKTLLLRNLVLKFNINKDFKSLIKITTQLKEVKELDKKFTYLLLSNIS